MNATRSNTSVVGLDHVTIRTRDLEASREFFINVLDLQDGPRPAAIQRIPGCWMYAGDLPLVHLIGSTGPADSHPSEAIDHVGIRLRDHDTFKRRLDQLGIRHSGMHLPEVNERRLFFHAPGGVLLEAVFDDRSDSTRSQSNDIT